ncbi:hypothetical protein LTS10_012819 [Elasticomyces elasticus]|nr:hypothetical protein LTS10_012819 [Elasticomyces elasticus]
MRDESELVASRRKLLRARTTAGFGKYYFVGSYLLIAGLCYYGMWVQPGRYGLWDHLDTVLTTGGFPYDSGFPLKRTYTGIKFVDNIFVYLSAVFMSGLKDWDPSFRFMNLYFLGILVQPITVWTVEGYRKRNLSTPLSLITIWYPVFQFMGIGIIMPLYYATYSFVSESESYLWAPSREVPIQYADSMIWAVVMGYTIPTFVLFLPWNHPFTLQNIESFWQISPLLVPLFCTILAFFHPSQRRLYIIAGVGGALFHIYCVGRVIHDPELTLSSVFWPNFSTQEKTLGEGVKFMFLIDLWALELATYIWSCQAVWDLERVARTDADIPKAMAVIAVGTVVLGPGAAVCAVWYWRETRLAQTSVPTVRA